MAWVEVVQWGSLETAREVARHESVADRIAPEPVRASVPACRCAGRCHCGTLVPYLLQQQLERECEFYREVH